MRRCWDGACSSTSSSATSRRLVRYAGTRGPYFDVGVKFTIEPNGGAFEVSPENDHASHNVNTPLCSSYNFDLDFLLL